MAEQSETTAVEDLKILVNKMMKEKNIKNYKIDLEGNSNAGDGYMGVMIFFKVISKEEGICYNLIFKSAGKGDNLRKITFMDKNFEREIFIYAVVFPTLKTYFLEHNSPISILEYVPALYGYCMEFKKESLLLENLKASGYVMWKKAEPLDFEHAVLVLRKFAKWHGTVIAYRDRNPSQFENWIPKLNDIRYDILVELGLVKHARIYYKKVLGLLEAKGELDLVRKYKELEDKLDQFFLPAVEQKDRLVITHGDCWVNNVMFKYNDKNNAPLDCKIFDFQVAQLNTPVEDLCFFLYGACGSSVLDLFDLLLKEYYDTLSSTVESLGSTLENIFTYDQLHDHWKKYGMNGVISSIEIIKLQCLAEDEVPDFPEIAKKGDADASKYLDFEMKNDDLYFQRLLSVFTHFGKRYL